MSLGIQAREVKAEDRSKSDSTSSSIPKRGGSLNWRKMPMGRVSRDNPRRSFPFFSFPFSIEESRVFQLKTEQLKTVSADGLRLSIQNQGSEE